jgi:hypothetical protein
MGGHQVSTSSVGQCQCGAVAVPGNKIRGSVKPTTVAYIAGDAEASATACSAACSTLLLPNVA